MRYSPRRHAQRAARAGRARYALSLLVVTVCFGLVALTLAAPQQPETATAAPIVQRHHAQDFELAAAVTTAVTRDGFSVTKAAPVAAGRA